MKRLFLYGAAVAAGLALTPQVHAAPVATDLVGGGDKAEAADSGVPASGMSTLNPLLNKIPLLAGPDRRHICLISDQVNRSWCLYVAIP